MPNRLAAQIHVSAKKDPSLDRRLVRDGRPIRFTDFIDEETLKFENELCAHTPLALVQSHAYLQVTRREFRLLQIRSADGRAAMQAVVYIHRSTRLRALGRAIAPKLGKAISADEEIWALKTLRSLISDCQNILTLRLQPLRTGANQLADFEKHAQLTGYTSCAPLEYTHTLKYATTAPLTELLAQMSKKTRAKVRHRSREEIELRVLTDSGSIAQCQTALNASFARTGGVPNCFDFESAFALARTQPDRVRIVGLYLPGRPNELLAYVIGFHGEGEMAEYVSAGSLSDPELRKIPFNYLLVWELIQWAHELGCEWLDLGGITSGSDDARASISEFKRHLSENEVELGREMLATLQPLRTVIYERLNQFKQLGPYPRFKMCYGLAASLILLAILALSFKFVN